MVSGHDKKNEEGNQESDPVGGHGWIGSSIEISNWIVGHLKFCFAVQM
jgi:hypothetical protein